MTRGITVLATMVPNSWSKIQVSSLRVSNSLPISEKSWFIITALATMVPNPWSTIRVPSLYVSNSPPITKKEAELAIELLLLATIVPNPWSTIQVPSLCIKLLLWPVATGTKLDGSSGPYRVPSLCVSDSLPIPEKELVINSSFSVRSRLGELLLRPLWYPTHGPQIQVPSLCVSNDLPIPEKELA
ncbi:41052_t:CDS:2, partial [Gigaspora margarita]